MRTTQLINLRSLVNPTTLYEFISASPTQPRAPLLFWDRFLWCGSRNYTLDDTLHVRLVYTEGSNENFLSSSS